MLICKQESLEQGNKTQSVQSTTWLTIFFVLFVLLRKFPVIPDFMSITSLACPESLKEFHGHRSATSGRFDSRVVRFQVCRDVFQVILSGIFCWKQTGESHCDKTHLLGKLLKFSLFIVNGTANKLFAESQTSLPLNGKPYRAHLEINI